MKRILKLCSTYQSGADQVRYGLRQSASIVQACLPSKAMGCKRTSRQEGALVSPAFRARIPLRSATTNRVSRGLAPNEMESECCFRSVGLAKFDRPSRSRGRCLQNSSSPLKMSKLWRPSSTPQTPRSSLHFRIGSRRRHSSPGTPAPYLLGRSFNNVHVACSNNDWFQYEELKDLGPACRSVSSWHRDVVTYGISMGGYAALAFSGALDAKRVVAISPQFSIDKTKVPWEPRWDKEANRIDFTLDDMPQQLSSTAEIFILFDPRKLDRLHVEEIQKIRAVTELSLPFSGHASTGFLSECGLLGDLVGGLLERGSVPPDLRRQVRQRRKSSPSYYAEVGEAIRLRWPDRSRALAFRARDLVKGPARDPRQPFR